MCMYICYLSLFLTTCAGWNLCRYNNIPVYTKSKILTATLIYSLQEWRKNCFTVFLLNWLKAVTQPPFGARKIITLYFCVSSALQSARDSDTCMPIRSWVSNRRYWKPLQYRPHSNASIFVTVVDCHRVHSWTLPHSRRIITSMWLGQYKHILVLLHVLQACTSTLELYFKIFGTSSTCQVQSQK